MFCMFDFEDVPYVIEKSWRNLTFRFEPAPPHPWLPQLQLIVIVVGVVIPSSSNSTSINIKNKSSSFCLVSCVMSNNRD